MHIRGGVTENKGSDDLQQLLRAIEKAVGEMMLNYFKFYHDTISFVEVYALSLYHKKEIAFVRKVAIDFRSGALYF